MLGIDKNKVKMQGVKKTRKFISSIMVLFFTLVIVFAVFSFISKYFFVDGMKCILYTVKNVQGGIIA